MNPLFKALGGAMPAMGGQMGNFNQMMQQFQEFKRTYQGDPEQEVRRLLASGRMTQQQLDQLQAVAQQFQALLG